ncbi:class I tRNA ligase family protein [Saccharothrix lopnurensis]|uniref:Class I tRNA ligase family protein n=1 Tax=Saccharothrix lopnurensis TaxID=1670621 RepID=A0ABW1P3L0_9PSEU
MPRFYVTTSHLDPARAEVAADVLARHHRLRGDRVRFLLVSPDRGTRDLLALSSTDTVTPEDPAHHAGVVRLWRACAAAGDLSRGPGDEWSFRLSRHTGRLRELIAAGELRIAPAARRDEVLELLAAGLPDVRAAGSAGRGVPVPDHPGLALERWWDVATGVTGLGYGADGPNHRRWWLESDRRVHVVGADGLRLHAVLWPAVLLSAGLPLPTDVYAHEPAGGLGLPGLDPPGLGLTGTDPSGPSPAGLNPPGPSPAGLDLAGLAEHHGADAVRWWLLRTPPGATTPNPATPNPATPNPATPNPATPNPATHLPTTPDGPPTPTGPATDHPTPPAADHPTTSAANRSVTLANDDLATALGALVDRVTTMVHRYRAGRPPVADPPADAEPLLAACRAAPEQVREALASFDFRRATDAVWRIVEQARRYADRARPWDLARADRAGDRDARDRLDAVLAALLTACRVLATELTPFLPTLAAGIAGQCITLTDSLAAPRSLFPRR